MEFKNVIIMALSVQITGVLVGLIIRLTREGIKISDLFASFALMGKFLVIYPLIFPVACMYYKKELSKDLARKVINESNFKNTRKHIFSIKNSICKDLSFPRVFITWFRVLKYINKNYDMFISENIDCTKKIILIKKESRKEIVPHSKFNIKLIKPKSTRDFFTTEKYCAGSLYKLKQCQ